MLYTFWYVNESKTKASVPTTTNYTRSLQSLQYTNQIWICIKGRAHLLTTKKN